MEQFLEKMQDVLDCEQEVKMNTALGSIEEWDSLAFVSFIAMAKAGFGKTVKPADVRNAKTVEDLYNLVK
ncbi:MAG: acyl carrier protein [Phascolarctobacterium sp.]|nr:acyl carrier protein [Candidatus Phascolarctobacterium caballi]